LANATVNLTVNSTIKATVLHFVNSVAKKEVEADFAFTSFYFFRFLFFRR